MNRPIFLQFHRLDNASNFSARVVLDYPPHKLHYPLMVEFLDIFNLSRRLPSSNVFSGSLSSTSVIEFFYDFVTASQAEDLARWKSNWGDYGLKIVRCFVISDLCAIGMIFHPR